MTCTKKEMISDSIQWSDIVQASDSVEWHDIRSRVFRQMRKKISHDAKKIPLTDQIRSIYTNQYNITMREGQEIHSRIIGNAHLKSKVESAYESEKNGLNVLLKEQKRIMNPDLKAIFEDPIKFSQIRLSQLDHGAIMERLEDEFNEKVDLCTGIAVQMLHHGYIEKKDLLDYRNFHCVPEDEDHE